MARAGWMLACTAALVLTAPEASHAQAGDTRSDANCDKRTQTEMNICATEAFRAADRELNAVYRDLMARLGPAGKAELRAVQRAWIAFRDLECEFEGNAVDGGSLEPFVYASCMEYLTRERTHALRNSYRRIR